MYIIYDYTNLNLADELQTQRRLPLPKVLELLKIGCEVLDHLHKLNIVHRSISTTAFCVTETGYKIDDFKESKIIEAEKDCIFDKSKTLDYFLQPPEHQRCVHYFASDLYSLGRVVFTAFFGKTSHPFSSLQKKQEEVRFPGHITCPKELKSLLGDLRAVPKSCLQLLLRVYPITD